MYIMNETQVEHWNAIKGLFKYIKGTVEHGLKYNRRFDTVNIIGYINYDFDKNTELICFITAYVFTVCGNCFSWRYKL